MTEEELADLLAHHLDTLLEGGGLPADIPPEVANLLGIAQNLSEAAPTPRPEFGPALKESLLSPSAGSNGAAPPANSVLGGSALPVVIVTLLVGAAVLAVVVSVIILGFVPSNDEAAPAIQTQVAPVSPTALSLTPSPVVASSPTSVTTPPPAESAPTGQTTSVPSVTATPIIDVLPVMTVTVEIIVKPPALVPGSGGGDGDGNSGNGGHSDGDHDRGHGNDSDGHDEDNPGRSGGD